MRDYYSDFIRAFCRNTKLEDMWQPSVDAEFFALQIDNTNFSIFRYRKHPTWTVIFLFIYYFNSILNFILTVLYLIGQLLFSKICYWAVWKKYGTKSESHNIDSRQFMIHYWKKQLIFVMMKSDIYKPINLFRFLSSLGLFVLQTVIWTKYTWV